MSKISSNFFILSEICPKSEKIFQTFLSKNLMSEHAISWEILKYELL